MFLCTHFVITPFSEVEICPKVFNRPEFHFSEVYFFQTWYFKVKHFSFFQSSCQIRLTPSFQVLELLRVERASILDPGNPDCKRAMVQPSTTMATDMMVKNFFIAQCFAIWLYSFIFVHLGEFHNGFKHGYGKFTVTTNNDVYTGTFDRGVRHGEVGI